MGVPILKLGLLDLRGLLEGREDAVPKGRWPERKAEERRQRLAGGDVVVLANLAELYGVAGDKALAYLLRCAARADPRLRARVPADESLEVGDPWLGLTESEEAKLAELRKRVYLVRARHRARKDARERRRLKRAQKRAARDPALPPDIAFAPAIPCPRCGESFLPAEIGEKPAARRERPETPGWPQPPPRPPKPAEVMLARARWRAYLESLPEEDRWRECPGDPWD